MTRPREAIESPIYQGKDEEIPWSLDISPWESANPTGIVVTVYDADGNDVTSTVMPSGSASVVGTTVIKLPVLKSLTSGTKYRVEVKYTDGNDATRVLEGYFIVIAED